MKFWNTLKYVLMVVFAAIIAGAVYMAQDEPSTVQQSVPQQPGQSKFNF